MNASGNSIIYMWNKLSVMLFGHQVPEAAIEAAIQAAFVAKSLSVQLLHTDPVDPIHGRNGWMRFMIHTINDADRLEITAHIEAALPELRQAVCWDGWVVETRTKPVRAVGLFTQR